MQCKGHEIVRFNERSGFNIVPTGGDVSAEYDAPKRRDWLTASGGVWLWNEVLREMIGSPVKPKRLGHHTVPKALGFYPLKLITKRHKLRCCALLDVLEKL